MSVGGFYVFPQSDVDFFLEQTQQQLCNNEEVISCQQFFAACKSKIDNYAFGRCNFESVKRSAARSSLLATAVLLCPFFLVRAQTVEIPMTARSIGCDASESLRLEIKRRAHQVTLYRGNVALKTYPIAVGRAGWETPLGSFKIYQMLEDPAWEHPLTGKVFPPGDPGNELGHYWIGSAKEGENCVG